MAKVPTLPPNVKLVKMKKSLHLIRGPEEVHNALLHDQYGIVVGANLIMLYEHGRKFYSSCTCSLFVPFFSLLEGFVWRANKTWTHRNDSTDS